MDPLDSTLPSLTQATSFPTRRSSSSHARLFSLGSTPTTSTTGINAEVHTSDGAGDNVGVGAGILSSANVMTSTSNSIPNIPLAPSLTGAMPPLIRSKASIATMEFTGPLNALSLAPSQKLLAVGGRDVLKIVQLDPINGFAEKRNLRVGKVTLNISTNDIHWNPNVDHLLATGATNGTVVIWNLQREGFKHVQEHVLSEHRRAVNRVAWHPTDTNILLSGSQDSTIKLWDKRANRTMTYQPKSESVRDVQFSPFQSSKFAAAFENGTVQVWDLRKPQLPEIKYQAHKGLVLSIDWHPSRRNMIATGSRDRSIKIWNISHAKQPEYAIQTITSVGRVKWRPCFPDQIASTASLMDSGIHVWDIRRPFIPIASIQGHADIASAIQWLDTPVVASSFSTSDAQQEITGNEYWQHILACSKDSTLRLHSLALAYKPYASVRNVALALSPSGRMAFSHDSIDRACSSLGLTQHISFSHPLFNVSDEHIGSKMKEREFSSEHPSTDRKKDGMLTMAPLAIVDTINMQDYPTRTFFAIDQQDTLDEEARSESSVLPQIFGFNSQVFKFLAEHYILYGDTFKNMCQHNARMAQLVYEEQTSNMWRMLEMMYRSTHEDTFKMVACGKPLSPKGNSIEVDPTSTSLLLQKLDNINPKATQSFNVSPYEPSSHSSVISPTLPSRGQRSVSQSSARSDDIIPASADPANISQEYSKVQDAVVNEVLEYYADLGDVQTVVSVVYVMKALNRSDFILGKSWLQRIYMSYIDLLHQLQLYTCANDLIRHCDDPSIQQMNMNSTTVPSNCSKCKKPLDFDISLPMASRTMCRKCSKVASLCSICQQPVQGMYVWCSICSHGGHIEHMKEWFLRHELCPTGCGHRCSYIIHMPS